ncbi:hypothetical protein [Sphingomonas sp. PAMC 26605]|uniref:hypothetical protein n=1 Tax=Sphingomonas sp. PAMC 26605 TaxID=1112214 RepID=UPI00026CB5F7|nr:hypothetical protein [Sphingomonas sp. PAMC 26605]
MSKIDLGLGDLSDIKPNAPRPQTASEDRTESAAIDTIGRDHGFTKPSVPATLPRRRRTAMQGEPQHQISIKGPVRVMERLIDYCDRERIAYWEALEKFLDLAEDRGR